MISRPSNNKKLDERVLITTGPLKTLLSIVAWAGGSMGGIGVILSACGYIVEHAYLESLGIPRWAFEAKAAEYIISGGNFLIGLGPLAVVGTASFFLYCWWFALALATASVSAWRLRLGAGSRLTLFAVLYAFWLFLFLFHLGGDGQQNVLFPKDPATMVAIFTFTAFVASGYFYTEVLIALPERATNNTKSLPLQSYLPRAPFFILLICSFVMMPYLRGAYATKRLHPIIEPIGSESAFLRELTQSSTGSGGGKPSCKVWQLIEIGERNAILRCVDDGSIVIVPAKKIGAFRILKRE